MGASATADPRDPRGLATRDFDKIDKDRNGWLDKGELHDGYMGMGPLAGKKSQDEVAAMFDVLDANGDDKITLEEYLNYCYFIEKGGDPAVLKVLARFAVGADLVVKFVESRFHLIKTFMLMEDADVDEMKLPRMVAKELKDGLQAAKEVRNRRIHAHASFVCGDLTGVCRSWIKFSCTARTQWAPPTSSGICAPTRHRLKRSARGVRGYGTS